jgi:hypothetical protein
MSNLAPAGVVVNHIHVSLLAGPPVDVASTDGSVAPAVLLAVVVAILLIGGALRQLGSAFGPLRELARAVLSAVTAAVLLISTLAVLMALVVLLARQA